MGVAGSPVQVRNPGAAKVETKSAPFMSASLPVAGFAVIDAKDLEEAVIMVSKTPCAVAHGVVEVWPLIDPKWHAGKRPVAMVHGSMTDGRGHRKRIQPSSHGRATKEGIVVA
jgi:hypothetical protein